MKRSFFDPLYKVVVLQDPVSFRPRGVFSLESGIELRKAVTPLIDSFEFARLSRLRQSALLYLVFPSATHTRFAHSLGCCHLAFTACASVTVRDPDAEGPPILLGKWLRDRKWEEEFLIALLLHDLGHFAFSHLVEGNERVKELLGAEVNHERAACEMILGSGIAYDAMSTLAEGISDPTRIASVLGEAVKADPNNPLELSLICYLISGDVGYLRRSDQRLRRQARILHALTSGLLDLDRIDHYRRDSEFMGLEIGFNYQALLHGLTVEGSSDDDSSIKLRLERKAIGHALSLLHLRERLTVDCFMHPVGLALGAMCNWAIGEFLSRKKQAGADRTRLARYLFLGDDELLGLLQDSGDSEIRRVARRLAILQPFDIVGCWTLRVPSSRDEVAKLAEQMNSTSNSGGMVLHKAHPAISHPATPGQEWLDLECLLDEHGNRLATSARYENQIAHFKRTGDPSRREVWFFAETSDKEKLVWIRKFIRNADIWEKEIPV